MSDWLTDWRKKQDEKTTPPKVESNHTPGSQPSLVDPGPEVDLKAPKGRAAGTGLPKDERRLITIMEGGEPVTVTKAEYRKREPMPERTARVFSNWLGEIPE